MTAGGKLSRHTLSTGSEGPLTLDELVIDALCKYIVIEQVARIEESKEK